MPHLTRVLRSSTNVGVANRGVFTAGVFKVDVANMGVFKAGGFKAGVFKVDVANMGVFKAGAFKVGGFKAGVVVVGVALAMTACGSQSASTGADPTSTTSSPSTTSTTSTHSTNQGQTDVFPLTLTRTGGVAGFHDVLVVASKGLASVTDKAQRQRQCQLTADALVRLTTAASQVPWPRITPTNTAPAFPDDLVTMVQSPAGGPVRLDDPQVGAGGPDLAEVLTDLSGDPAASKLCKQV